PGFGAGWHGIGDPVGPAAAGIWRVDQCLEVAAVHQDEAGGSAEDLRAAVRVVPRHDVVGLTGQDVGWDIGGRQVDRGAQDRQRAGDAHRVLHGYPDHVVGPRQGEDLGERGPAHVAPAADAATEAAAASRVVRAAITPSWGRSSAQTNSPRLATCPSWPETTRCPTAAPATWPPEQAAATLSESVPVISC